MIDVPIQVKDALREGSYKKNYRFNIFKKFVDISVFSNDHQSAYAPISGTYVLYNNTTPNSFRYVEIYHNSDYRYIYCPENDSKTWLEFEANAGDSIYVAFDGDNTVTLGVHDPESTELDFVIDNNNLVAESVHIDERMCTGDTLKFGLCEGSSLEFRYFGKQNIRGCRLNAFVDVSYMGMNVELTDINTTYTVIDAGFYDVIVPAGSPSFDIDMYKGGYPAPSIEVPHSNMDQTISAGNLDEGDQLIIASSNSVVVTVKRHDNAPIPTWYSIPMGFFDVKDCSRQASTGIIKVNAYNKLQSDYLDTDVSELIQQEFGSENSVYLMDVLSYLLSNYAIDNKTYVPVAGTMSPWADVFLKSANFSPFRYSNVYGNQGPMSPRLLRTVQSITTSTNIYLGGAADRLYFDLSSITDPIKISFIEDFDYIDRDIYDRIRLWLTYISTSTDWETLWNRFKALGSKDGTSFPDYFFNIQIEYKDNTSQVYGNYCNNSSGSFSDLAKLTLRNVKSITVYAPINVEFGKLSDGWISRIDGVDSGDHEYSNYIRLWGENGYYIYDDPNTSEERTARYYTSKTKNGDDLPEHYVEEYVKVNRITNTTGIDFVEIPPTSITNVTLRELQSADFETKCQFGQLSRVTDLFSGVELNNSRLYPADTLYPLGSLYPYGARESSFRSQYSKLWADEDNVHKWRYLIITYKGLDGQGNETEYTLQKTVNTDGTDDYEMNNNWLFKNLVWTAADINDYATAMVTKMQSMSWFPFEMWCAGLPYLEVGDEIEIPLGEKTYTSYILQRQLKGIQNLQDTYINGTLSIF